jgi:Family of unknown function (DUF6297)
MRATPATITSEASSTEQALGLLRDLHRRPASERAAGITWWLYLAGLAVFSYGGWLVAAIVRALRHPPPPTADTAALLRAAPASLCALGLLLLAALLWDARWRGPVTLSPPAADWLLDTPVDRGRLLRPQYRSAAGTNMLAGAVAGLVPAALLLAAGLGGSGVAHSLALAGAAILGAALLTGLGTSISAWAEARPAARELPALRSATWALAIACAAVAALSAAVPLPASVGTALLWSGPWGWAAQASVNLAGGSAPHWPAATVALAVLAAGAAVAADRAAASVPAATLRLHARTIGHMTAAMLNLDARRVTTAYRGATGAYSRVRLTVKTPLSRQLVLPWRDLTALIRAPIRLVWSALLAVTATGLAALAVRSPHAALLTLSAALICGYLAAAGLCEGARLDGDDPGRSSQLPFRYRALPWWHAIVPCLALAILAGAPATILTILTGHAVLLPLVATTILVLVGGALVNSFRGQLEAEMFQGFDTPMGHSSGVTITLWYVTGPLLSAGPMLVLWYQAVTTRTAGAVITATVLAAALAAWLGRIAARRASRLRSG